MIKRDKLYYNYPHLFNKVLERYKEAKTFELSLVQNNNVRGLTTFSNPIQVQINVREQDILYILTHEFVHILDYTEANAYYNYISASQGYLAEYVADKVAMKFMDYLGKHIDLHDSILYDRIELMEKRLGTNGVAMTKAENRISELYDMMIEEFSDLKGILTEVLL